MIIGPTLLIVLFTVLLVSSLMMSVYSNINKTYPQDDKAKDYALYAGAAGFGGIGVMIGYMFLNRMYFNYENVYVHSLLWLWVVLIALAVLSYMTYEKLSDSYHFPITGKHTLNKTEKMLSIIAFSFAIAGIASGLTYVITTLYEKNLKGDYEVPKEVSKEIEMDDLISELTETSF